MYDLYFKAPSHEEFCESVPYFYQEVDKYDEEGTLLPEKEKKLLNTREGNYLDIEPIRFFVSPPVITVDSVDFGPLDPYFYYNMRLVKEEDALSYETHPYCTGCAKFDESGERSVLFGTIPNSPYRVFSN